MKKTIENKTKEELSKFQEICLIPKTLCQIIKDVGSKSVGTGIGLGMGGLIFLFSYLHGLNHGEQQYTAQRYGSILEDKKATSRIIKDGGKYRAIIPMLTKFPDISSPSLYIWKEKEFKTPAFKDSTQAIDFANDLTKAGKKYLILTKGKDNTLFGTSEEIYDAINIKTRANHKPEHTPVFFTPIQEKFMGMPAPLDYPYNVNLEHIIETGEKTYSHKFD